MTLSDRAAAYNLAHPEWTASHLYRGKATRALAEVVPVGGYMAWLDTVWPMHSKACWVTVGRITVIRSTNHRVRLCSIFERV